jgi:hypothetical protein
MDPNTERFSLTDRNIHAHISEKSLRKVILYTPDMHDMFTHSES